MKLHLPMRLSESNHLLPSSQPTLSCSIAEGAKESDLSIQMPPKRLSMSVRASQDFHNWEYNLSPRWQRDPILLNLTNRSRRGLASRSPSTTSPSLGYRPNHPPPTREYISEPYSTITSAVIDCLFECAFGFWSFPSPSPSRIWEHRRTVRWRQRFDFADQVAVSAAVDRYRFGGSSIRLASRGGWASPVLYTKINNRHIYQRIGSGMSRHLGSN
jgi:hypothetical protein